MRFALHIARRYLRSPRKSRLLSRVPVIAVAGITLGVMVLNLTLAIMNGLHAELRRSFVDTMPMITITTSDPAGFADLQGTLATVLADPEVTGAAAYVRQEVIVTRPRSLGPTRNRGAIAWGVDPQRIDTVQPFSRQLVPGPEALAALRQTGGTPRILLGIELGMGLFSAVGDTVLVTAPRGELSLDKIEAESRRFVVAGYLDSGTYEFDSRFAYLNLEDARSLFGYEARGAGLIGARVDDIMRADVAARRLEAELGPSYSATDWMALNANLFHWVQVEKVMMGVLLALIVLVASFNIIGILTMMVGERTREIGILLAMGASRPQIQGVFLLNGLWLGINGILMGSLLGWLGTQYLIRFGIKIPGDVYILDHVPCIAEWPDFLIVAGVALGITVLATLVPSREASRLDPVEIIRYT
jgi:lipoprotein-releasing system permease protein